MRINYLFSGIDKEKGFNEKQSTYLKKDIKENSIITIIASSFDDIDKNDLYFKKTIGWFNNVGIYFAKENLIDSRINKVEAKEYINNSNIVYLMGGDPLNEMESIKNYDLVDFLKEKEGITIGISAGSMNQASIVAYKTENKEDEIISYEGLGLTDISIYPHLDFKNHDLLKEVFEVSKENKIIVLPNESFIRIENDIPEYIGKYYIVENETIDYKGANYEPINHLGTIKLETERLLLRRTVHSDLEEFFYMQLNPNLRRFLGPTKLGNNLEKNKKYFDETKYEELNYYRWTIVKKEDNKILGTIYLNMHDEKAKIAGIDYWIREDEWSKGYVTEASKCILDFAFNQLNLNRIESCGAKDNPGTWKVMKKIGLKYEGIRKKGYFYYYGGIQDLVLYGLTKEEYLENKDTK